MATFGKQPVKICDSVISEQETIVKSQDVCTEASGSTLHCITTGYRLLGSYSSYNNRTETYVPGVHAGSLGGICLSTPQHLPQGPGISVEEMRAKELLSKPSSYPK